MSLKKSKYLIVVVVSILALTGCSSELDRCIEANKDKYIYPKEGHEEPRIREATEDCHKQGIY